MSAPRFPHLPEESWSLYLDDALDGAARERVEAHVDACGECRRVLLMADPSFAFRSLRGPAPEGTWDGFWDELRPQLAPPERSLRPRLLRAAAIAAVLAGVAVLTVTMRQPPPAPSADPCAASSVAGLRLSRALTQAECEALYGAPLDEAEPEVVVIRDLDLRGL